MLKISNQIHLLQVGTYLTLTPIRRLQHNTYTRHMP